MIIISLLLLLLICFTIVLTIIIIINHIRVNQTKNYGCWLFTSISQRSTRLVGGIPTPLKNMSSSVGIYLWNIYQHLPNINLPVM